MIYLKPDKGHDDIDFNQKVIFAGILISQIIIILAIFIL